MKTPEEIKKGLTTCSSGEHGTECLECVYEDDCTAEGCYIPLSKDVLEYIQRLETERDEFQRLFVKTYDELEEANKRLDGVDNCTNCAYGDGTVNGTTYCYDCRWFTDKATRIKMDGGNAMKDISPRKCPYCGYMAGIWVLRRCCTKFWKKQYWVQCVLCGYCTKKALTKRGAIKKWNRRRAR